MNASDPRLTAHALGEADAESAELIARDPALAAEAEATRRFAERLRDALHAEAAPALDARRRDAILAEARPAAGSARWWQHGWALGAAAACLALALGAAIYFQARHLNSLRAVAGDAPAPPPSVKVRWAEDARLLPPDAVAAPRAPAPATRPTYQGPAPVAARPLASPSNPALAGNGKPAPGPAQASAAPAMPPSGTLPADPERVNAAPLRPAPRR